MFTIYQTSAIQNSLTIVNSFQTRQGTVQYNSLNIDSSLIVPGNKTALPSNTIHYAFSPLATYLSYPNLIYEDASGQYESRGQVIDSYAHTGAWASPPAMGTSG